MPIEECPHCIQKVMFSDNGKCPACGKDKFILPGKSREQIIFEQEKENLIEEFFYTKKKIIGLLLGGILLFGISLFIAIWTTIYGNVIVWFYGGIITGAALIYYGYILFRHKNALKKILINDYKYKVNNR